MNDSKYYGMLLGIISGITIQAGDTRALREIADVVDETAKRLDAAKKGDAHPAA